MGEPYHLVGMAGWIAKCLSLHGDDITLLNENFVGTKMVQLVLMQ